MWPSQGADAHHCYILLEGDVGGVAFVIQPIRPNDAQCILMTFYVVYDGCACLDGSNVGIGEFLASKYGVYTPAYGARQGVVKYNVDVAQFRLGIDVAPFDGLALEYACKIFDGNTAVRVSIVNNDGQSVVGNRYCPG